MQIATACMLAALFAQAESQPQTEPTSLPAIEQPSSAAVGIGLLVAGASQVD